MMNDSKKPRTVGQWVVLVLVISGAAAALIWRFVWPVTGVQADLVFAAVMVAGVIAAKLAGWY